MTGAGSGDRLARGQKSAIFPPAGTSISQKAWDKMFEDFDAEKYRGDSDAEKTGNASFGAGKTIRSRRG